MTKKMLVTNIFSIVVCLYVMLYSSDEKELKPKAKTKIVDTHNDLRRNVKPTASDMLKMVWSNEAAINAQNVADSCHGFHSHPSKRVIKHPHFLNCGENIYMSSVEDDWDIVIRDWHDEHFSFTYGKGATEHGAIVGHYTQVVWSNSSFIGCGLAVCNGPFPFLFICHYCPAGNDRKHMAKPYRKGTPCSACKGKCENNLCVWPPGKNN